MSKKTVSLVLSSGGARGMAHIGVIEALEESGYEIASIAGCSAGALIGGMHSSGNLPKFKDWICNLDRIDVFSLMDFTLSSKGFIKGDKVFAALKKIIEDRLIEELNIIAIVKRNFLNSIIIFLNIVKILIFFINKFLFDNFVTHFHSRFIFYTKSGGNYNCCLRIVCFGIIFDGEKTERNCD